MKRLCVFHSNRLIIVQGLLVFLLLLKPGTWQGATRNRAFVMLTKCLLAPSASPTDSRARTASELFDSLSQQDPERYQVYSFRLQGMTGQLLRLVTQVIDFCSVVDQHVLQNDELECIPYPHLQGSSGA